MSEAVLGHTLDIHGGGHDLIFPHHENEIAQSVCAHGGAPYARYWLHNGFLNFVNSQGEAEKMSKSLGNVKLVHDLVQLAPAEALRLLLLSAHYRQPLEWSEAAVQESRKRLDGFYEALRPVASLTAPEAAVPAGVLAALEDDLNTPLALAELSVLAKILNKAEGEAAQIHAKAQLLAAGKVLGLLQQAPQAWFAGSGGGKAIAEAEIEAQLAARLLARQTKQWAESDRIRDALKAQGVLVEDGKDGQRWKWL
jgi:cysteinyl-tRNA synthetase